MEAGTSLSGPLSAYACPVHMDSVHLDARTGQPLKSPSTPAAAKGGKQDQAGSVRAMQQQAQALRQTSQRAQLRLMQLLKPLGFSLEQLKAKVGVGVDEPGLGMSRIRANVF